MNYNHVDIPTLRWLIEQKETYIKNGAYSSVHEEYKEVALLAKLNNILDSRTTTKLEDIDTDNIREVLESVHRTHFKVYMADGMSPGMYTVSLNYREELLLLGYSKINIDY